MWWGLVAAALAVTWSFGMTHARLEMWMAPKDQNVYYVEEGRSSSIECFVIVDIGVRVNLTWSGPAINASKPQRVSSNPHENYERVGNWLNITNFSNTTAGEYKCRAITSASNDLTQTIRLAKSCDVGKFSPPSCEESCSEYCNPWPDGAKGRNCHHISGKCLYGCWKGHTGLKCTECDVGRFSPPFCNKTCSPNCKPGPDWARGRNCDHINGSCLSGCQKGYKNPNCTEKIDELDHKVIGGVVGGCLVFIVVVISVVLLVVWYTKKRKKGKKRTSSKGKERPPKNDIPEDPDQHKPLIEESQLPESKEQRDLTKEVKASGDEEDKQATTQLEMVHFSLDTLKQNKEHRMAMETRDMNEHVRETDEQSTSGLDVQTSKHHKHADISRTALHNGRNDCVKNPGHEKFIPIADFKKVHLPEGYQNHEFTDFITTVISLTVKLVVNYVSRQRPKKYTLSEYRGKYHRTYGSGRVFSAVRRFTDVDSERCPCPKCETLSEQERKKQWGEFLIATACFIVFNEKEARETQCDIDYDGDTDCETCPKLYGVSMKDCKPESEFSLISCVTHDRDVATKLEQRIRDFNRMRANLEDWYSNNSTDAKYVVIVSHPHGVSKHITLGKWIGQQKEKPYKWIYAAETCDGSAGAPVCVLGDLNGKYVSVSTHSGRNRDTGNNESGSDGHLL